MARMLDGKACAKQILDETRVRADAFARSHGRRPKLAVIMAGNNPASAIYVAQKERACAKAGVDVQTITRGDDVTVASLMIAIDGLNHYENIDGIMLQLPLPDSIDARRQAIIDHISPLKDVDGITSMSQGRLVTGQRGLISCTPAGIMELLRRNDIDVRGKRVLIIGRSTLVGKPLAALMTSAGAIVTVSHRGENLDDLHNKSVPRADIVVSAAGCPNLVRAKDVMRGQVLVDVGITRLEDGGITGDFEPACSELGVTVTPVPGGVGPMTVAMLVSNTVTAAEMRYDV